MKCYTYIDKNHDEEVLIYAKERNEIVNEIETLVNSNNVLITGVYNEEIVKINPIDVTCFISENNKVFAMVNNKKYQIKQKLYQLEEMEFNTYFVKLNQSCYANMKKIKKFESTIGASLKVIFDNNYFDYISRRELKNVKVRMGI